MKRIPPLLAGVLASVTGGVVASAQGASPIARASHSAKVELRHTSVGKVLVDSSGFTLYRFTRDSHNKDRCVSVSGCTGTWPALTSSGKPIAGPGVKASLLSTIKLPNGTHQVTYAGHPLYLYAPSEERGETAYVGAEQFGGIWYAVSASGSYVK